MKLFCNKCRAEYAADQPRWRCACGAPLDISFVPHYNCETIAQGPTSLWRYQEALPLAPTAEPLTLGEGMTPLRQIHGSWGNALFKCDFMMPSGSYKDRGTAVMLRQLQYWGIKEVIEDSSGNAGASVAAYSNLAGIKARIFIPEATSAGKAAQIALYGAELVRVPGSREQTTLAAEAAAAEGIFYASHNWSPWFVHGVKTLALEIWEQLGWRAPNAVIAPVGNGSLILGLYQGFSELLQAGQIETLPRIFAVQSAACAPLAEAFAAGESEPRRIIKGETMAEGIASALPVKGREILQAARASGGQIITVDEDEIWRGVIELARSGAYIEPTSGTAPAALLKLRQSGVLAADEEVVVELTGFGLKATDKLVSLRERYAERL